MTYWPPRSTTLQNFSPIAQTVYEICVTKVFHFLALGGLTPEPKFTKRGDDLLDSEVYHPAKFHRSTPTHVRDIPYKKSCGQTHTQKKQIKSKRYRRSPPSPQIVYNTGRHRPCGGLFVTMSATVGRVCSTGLAVERVIDFSIFDLGGLPLGRRSPKGEMTYYPRRSTIVQNFSPIA